jgi:hypothetical protein
MIPYRCEHRLIGRFPPPCFHTIRHESTPSLYHLYLPCSTVLFSMSVCQYVPVCKYSTVQHTSCNPGPLHHPIGNSWANTRYEPSTLWEHGEYGTYVTYGKYSTTVLLAVLYR